MGIIADIERLRDIVSQSYVIDPHAYYVIDPDQRDTYTQELVDHLANLPMFAVDSGEPCDPPTYAEIERSIISGDMRMMGVKICYAPHVELQPEFESDQPITATPNCIVALQTLVEANARYVELTGRPQEAIAIHPRHARELLELLSNKS